MEDFEKPKALPSTMRERMRYLTFEVISEAPVDFKETLNVIWSSILSYLGEHGTASASVWMPKNLWEEKTQMGVVRCSHDAVEAVRASLALVNRVGDKRIIINVVGVTGTLKSAKTKFFGLRSLSNYGK